MKNLFDQRTFDDSLKRLYALKQESYPIWGKMNVAQMLHHCQKPLEVIMHKTDYNLKPNLLAKLFFKRMLYNDKSWPRGMNTPKSFKVESTKDFDEEIANLTTLLEEFYEKRRFNSWPKHPVFGNFTPEQIGKMQFKHLDHHLKQFGV